MLSWTECPLVGANEGGVKVSQRMEHLAGVLALTTDRYQ